MTDFRNSFDNKTLTIEGRAVSIRTDNGLNIASRVKETDLTAIAASVLELYGTPPKAGYSLESYAHDHTSDEALLWQAYGRLKALGIRAERKAAQEAEKSAKDADAATLLEKSKQTIAMAYTGKYFSELGRTKRSLVTALASQQLALKEALNKETK